MSVICHFVISVRIHLWYTDNRKAGIYDLQSIDNTRHIRILTTQNIWTVGKLMLCLTVNESAMENGKAPIFLEKVFKNTRHKIKTQKTHFYTVLPISLSLFFSSEVNARKV